MQCTPFVPPQLQFLCAQASEVKQAGGVILSSLSEQSGQHQLQFRQLLGKDKRKIYLQSSDVLLLSTSHHPCVF